jgi:hypothetical protein
VGGGGGAYIRGGLIFAMGGALYSENQRFTVQLKKACIFLS